MVHASQNYGRHFQYETNEEMYLTKNYTETKRNPLTILQNGLQLGWLNQIPRR